MHGDIYWDSCMFISLLCRKRESVDPKKIGRYEISKYYWDLAKAGHFFIYTSVMTKGEVLSCDDFIDGSKEAREFINSMIMRQRHVKPVQLDGSIIDEANEIRFNNSKLGLLDCYHIASAIKHKVAVLHTLDGTAEKPTPRHMISYHARFPILPSGMLAIIAPEIPNEDTGIIALSKGGKS